MKRSTTFREPAAKSPRILRAGAAPIVISLLAAAACGGSTNPLSPSVSPSGTGLPLASASAHYEYHYASGDTVDAGWQEQYHEWATARLGVQLPQKVCYYKYQSRQDMGDHTGKYNTNGFADVARFEIHVLAPIDNHEVVHLLMSVIGNSSALFSEGVAVAFQTDPANGVFESRFNREEVHQAARRYLESGELVLPLDRIIESNGFRAITDSVLSYREAGSFVRFLIDRYGLDRFLAFYRSGLMPDSAKAVIKARFQSATGVSFEEAEAAWLDMLRARG